MINSPHARPTGLTSDANLLIQQARVSAQRYLYQYQEPIPVEQLVRSICDYKQAYTQYGGQFRRPFHPPSCPLSTNSTYSLPHYSRTPPTMT